MEQIGIHFLKDFSPFNIPIRRKQRLKEKRKQFSSLTRTTNSSGIRDRRALVDAFDLWQMREIDTRLRTRRAAAAGCRTHWISRGIRIAFGACLDNNSICCWAGVHATN